jgi:hypothetical protein
MCSSEKRKEKRKTDRLKSNKQTAATTTTITTTTTTTTIFNVFTVASNKKLTRPDFVLTTICTHDSSTLVHELNIISVLDIKFTLSKYDISSTRYSEVNTKGG